MPSVLAFVARSAWDLTLQSLTSPACSARCSTPASRSPTGTSDLADSEPGTRWAHGFEATLRPRPLPYLDPADAGYTKAKGTLKMRRVWAYTCAAGERHDALAGELFEGHWEFGMVDLKRNEYVIYRDTFFAVRWPEGERREGKRELANQRMPSRTRIERWREEVLPGPYDHRAWQPDASMPKFRCHRTDHDDRDWSLDEPPPSVNNFLKWVNTKVGEDGDLDWKHPPEPDNGPRPSRRRVNIMFKWPKVEESDPAAHAMSHALADDKHPALDDPG